MRILFFIVAASFLIVGCASKEWVNKPTEQLLTAKKEPVMKPMNIPVPPPEKEPGALWSDSSPWNEVYSVALARKTGDVVFIKATPNFVSQVVAQGGKLPYVSLNAEEKGGIPMVVREVLPRGVFKISTVQPVQGTVYDPMVRFSAKLRDRDVSEDDYASADLMFDLAIEVTPPAKLPEPEKKEPVKSLVKNS